MALVMAALTVFVIAMIASYSGAFAKPTLHHLNVAVAGPQQLVDGIRGQDTLAVTQVADAAAARDQVYDRKTDAAFVVDADRRAEDLRRGRRRAQRRQRRGDRRPRHRRQGGSDAERRRRRPDHARRPAGHRRVLRRHLPVDRRHRGCHAVRPHDGQRAQAVHAGAAHAQPRPRTRRCWPAA